ncbi:MAG: hypothetical protein HQM08_21185 [Candidatus Riflebacteria bacterium]|nr:hypothetical protein [Candidatus Riflebacteria bacterium]
MKRKLFITVLALVVLSISTASAYNYSDLQYANSMRDSGNFYGAKDLYQRIANGFFTDNEIQREAAYFIGFCDIKMNNPWSAIDSYRWFLNRFDNGNFRFVPDALFVLGRTYEDVRDLRNANYYYNECIRRFQYGEFPEKSRDRLRVIGGYYGAPNYLIQTTQKNDETKASTGKATKSISDPFEGGFSLDQSRVERVNALIQAVSKSEGVEEAVSKLSTSDNELEIVKENLKINQEKQKFDSLHEVK